jgi:hypothetical protein
MTVASSAECARNSEKVDPVSCSLDTFGPQCNKSETFVTSHSHNTLKSFLWQSKGLREVMSTEELADPKTASKTPNTTKGTASAPEVSSGHVLQLEPHNVLLFLIAFRLVNSGTIQTFFQPDEYFQALEPAWQWAFGQDAGAWITWVR